MVIEKKTNESESKSESESESDYIGICAKVCERGIEEGGQMIFFDIFISFEFSLFLSQQIPTINLNFLISLTTNSHIFSSQTSFFSKGHEFKIA